MSAAGFNTTNISTVTVYGGPADEPKKSLEDLDNDLQDEIVKRTEKFAKESVSILSKMGISTMDGNFERMFPTLFHTMVETYTRATEG